MMRALLDTNVIISREAAKGVGEDIGILFQWLNKLHYEKCIHPETVKEIQKYSNKNYSQSLINKLTNYSVLKTTAALDDAVWHISEKYDSTENDIADTKILNEVFCGRVDLLITEDKKIHLKADLLGLSEKVFYISDFINICLIENPDLVNYRIQNIQQKYFGEIDLRDPFFDSLKKDYVGFESWFNKKADEQAYVCYEKGNLCAFLYLKVETESEVYSDITPIFKPGRRLKVGTFKATLNGYRLGERFIKIIVDNALHQKVNEVYVTLFDTGIEQKRLVRLLEEYGFEKYGVKNSASGEEAVYIKQMHPSLGALDVKKRYPFIDYQHRFFMVSIYPEYHTSLLPDSILNNEDPRNFIGQESYKNAISKVFVSRSIYRDLRPGDVVIFYRTGGIYKSVITTIGIVEEQISNIASEKEFCNKCKKLSVFDDEELRKQWNWSSNNRPFIVRFLYAYSFPRRLNMKQLIDLNIIKDINSAPRGFTEITLDEFKTIIKETQTDENIIIN